MQPLPATNCPECGINHDVLLGALYDSDESYIQAEWAVKHCATCRRRLGHHLTENRLICETIDKFLLRDKLPEGKRIVVRE